MARGVPPASAAAIRQAVKEVAVWGWEVDALVADDLREVVAKCNRLVRARLTDAEVDWVVLSGNGARYPLVERLLADELHVAYLDERLTVDGENLKAAVARGAVLARMYQRSPQRATVHFAPRDLSRLLPFDIAWHDNSMNLPERLFGEFTPYADLADATREVHLAVDRQGPTRSFTLVRRFPGDAEYAPFARYEFRQPLSGRLLVNYDAADDRFLVADADTGEAGQYYDLTDPLRHQSPMTRADF